MRGWGGRVTCVLGVCSGRARDGHAMGRVTATSMTVRRRRYSHCIVCKSCVVLGRQRVLALVGTPPRHRAALGMGHAA